MSRGPGKGQQCRVPWADSGEDQYLIDDFLYQSEMPRAEVVRRPVSSGGFTFFYPPKSPQRMTRDCKGSFAPGDNRPSSKLYTKTEKTSKTLSHLKFRDVYSCSSQSETYGVSACKSLGPRPLLGRCRTGDDASSAMKCPVAPGGGFPRVSSHDHVSEVSSKEKPSDQTVVQNRKGCLNNHSSFKIGAVDSIFQREDTMANLKRRLAICEEAIDYFLCASLSSNGPLINMPCFKTVKAEMDTHLSFPHLSRFLVRSHAFSMPVPDTGEHSSVGAERPGELKNARKVQEDNSNKSKKNTLMNLPESVSDESWQELRDCDLYNINTISELEMDRTCTHGSSLGANTVGELCTSTRCEDEELKELIKITRPPMDNITRCREPWQNSRIRSPKSNTEDASYPWEKDYSGYDDLKHSEQTETHDSAWRVSRHSQNHDPPKTSSNAQTKEKANAEKNRTINPTASPLCHKGMIDRVQVSVRQTAWATENRSLRSTERYDGTNRSFLCDKRFSSHNDGTQKYNKNYCSENGTQNTFSPESPERCSSSTKKYSRFCRSSRDLDSKPRTDPPLQASPRRDHLKADAIKADPTVDFGLSASKSRVSKSSHVSDNDFHNNWAALRCPKLNASEAICASEVRPKTTSHKQHMGFLKNPAGSVHISDRCLTYKQGEGQLKRQARCDSFENVTMKTNWNSLNAPAKTSRDLDLVDSGLSESATTEYVEETKLHLTEEILFNSGQSSYRMPHSIEFPDTEKLLKRHTPVTSHTECPESADSQTPGSSSVSIYAKIPDCILKRCTPDDPRRQYLVVDNSSNKEAYSVPGRKSHQLKGIKKNNHYENKKARNAQEKSFSSSDFKFQEQNAAIKMEKDRSTRIVFMKKNTTNSKQKKLSPKSKESTKKEQTTNCELTKTHILHLLDDVCTRPTLIEPLPEDKTIVNGSLASPNLCLSQQSTLVDACSPVRDFRGTGSEVLSSLIDACSPVRDSRGTGSKVLSSLVDACSPVRDSRGTGSKVLSSLVDACSPVRDSRDTGSKVLSSLVDACSPVRDSRGTGSKVLSSLVDACSSVRDSRGTGSKVLSSLVDACSMVRDSRGTGSKVLSSLVDACNPVRDSRGKGSKVLSSLVDACNLGVDSHGTGSKVLSSLVDACSPVRDSRGTDSGVLSSLVDACSSGRDSRGTGSEVLSSLVDACSSGGDSRGTGSKVLSSLVDACSPVRDSRGTGSKVLSSLVDACSSVRESRGTGSKVLSSLVDACSMVRDSRGTGSKVLSSLVDACTPVRDSRGKGVGDGVRGFGVTGSDLSGGERNSKLCPRVAEPEGPKLTTLKTPKSLKQLCLSILSKYQCPQTDTRPCLENKNSMNDHKVARDFHRVRYGPRDPRPRYKRTYRDSFTWDNCGQFAKRPRESRASRELYPDRRPFRGHWRPRNFNNSNESEDERDTGYSRQTNRPAEVCDGLIFDDLSTPIVLIASDRVYHVSSRGRGWTSGTDPSVASITCEVTARLVDSSDELVSSETTTRLSIDDFHQTDCGLPNFIDLGQESDLLETGRPVDDSRDILAQVMSSAGLDDFLLDNYMRCNQLIEPLLFEQLLQPNEAGSKILPNFLLSDYQGSVCEESLAELKEETLKYLEVEGVTGVNCALENGANEKWSQQEVYDDYYDCYSHFCTNEQCLTFENACCEGELDFASPDSFGMMLAPSESVNPMPESLGHGQLDGLSFPPSYCYSPSEYYKTQASNLLTSAEAIFPGVIPGFASISPPYSEGLCSITYDSQQLAEALDFLSDNESCDLGEDFHANLNISSTGDDRSLQKAREETVQKAHEETVQKAREETVQKAREETVNTADGSVSEVTLPQPDSEKFVKAVAAYTSYGVSEVPGGGSPRNENKEDGHDKGGSFVARTLDCINRYGLRDRQPSKRSLKKDLKTRDRELRVSVKTSKQKRIKDGAGCVRLDPECIGDWVGLNIQNVSLDGVNHLKPDVRTTKCKQWATETPCADPNFLDERAEQGKVGGSSQDLLAQEQVNQDSGETRDRAQVGCNTPGANTGQKDDNVFGESPTIDGVDSVSPGTLTNFFDRQQESTELFTRQLSKLCPGFLKHNAADKRLPPQRKPSANRISTKIVYILKSNKSKMGSVGMRTVEGTSQPPSGGALDYNNNASWDNIQAGSSKMKVAKTDKGKDPKKIASNDSRLHLPRVFDKGVNQDKDKKKLEKISETFRKQYQSIHQAPGTLSLTPLSGNAPPGNSSRSHDSSADTGQLPEIGQARGGNENQNKSPMYVACSLPAVRASAQENSKVLNFVKRLDSRYGDQLAHGDVDTSRRLKKCCKSYLNKHTGSKVSLPHSMDKKKVSPNNCAPCATSDKIEDDINFLAAHNSNLIDSSEGVNPTTKETQPAETVDSLPPEATKPPIKPGNDGRTPYSGQGSAKNTNASSAKKTAETKMRPSSKKAPSLRSDIASSVSRLTTKPPSPTTKLMYKIQTYEQEFRKPFNIHECSRAALARAAPKFSREKYTKDIQKLLPLCGGSGEAMTQALEAKIPKQPLGSASMNSLRGRHASKITTKSIGGLPKRFEDFPEGAIKDDQLETRQTIMASLPSELKLGDGKVPEQRVLAVDSVKTPHKISPSKSVQFNERKSEGDHLEIKSLAQLKQNSERSFSLEFPDIFDHDQSFSHLSDSMATGTISLNRPSAEVSSVKCVGALTYSQQDVKMKATTVSSSTPSAQKEFYPIALPAGISEELLKEVETDPEPKSGPEEVKSLEEELEEFLSECSVNEKDYNDYNLQEFDDIDVDDEEIRLLDNRSRSDRLENRSRSDRLENNTPKGPTRAKIAGGSDSSTSPSTCLQSNEAKPECETAASDAEGSESLGGVRDAPGPVDQRPGSGDDSSCDIFRVESLTSIKKSLDCAFGDQFKDLPETCVEGQKEEENFWGDSADYWTNSNPYLLPEPRSFKKLTPIQEDPEEEEDGMTSNEQ